MNKFYSFFAAAALLVLGTFSAYADDAHPWAGTFTLMCSDDAPYLYYTNYETGEDDFSCIKYGYEPKAEFNVTITWMEEEGIYKVTNFFGFDCDANGGYELKIVDEKNAQIILPEDRSMYYHTFDTIPADTTYETLEDGSADTIVSGPYIVGLKLWDGSGSFPGFEPIDVHMNSDGQISLGGFKVMWYSPEGKQIPSVWFTGAVPLNGGDEPEEVVEHDWKGIYRMDVNMDMNMSLDGNEYPLSGVFEVGDDGFGNFVVTKFLSYDTKAANALTGGIYISQSKKKDNTGSIDCDAFMNFLQTDETGFAGLALYDGFGNNGGIEIVYKEATNTIEMDYFNIGQFDGAAAELACAYFGAVCTPITEEEALAITSVKSFQPAEKQIFNANGVRLSEPQKGINIIREVIDGKVVTRKVLVK